MDRSTRLYRHPIPSTYGRDHTPPPIPDALLSSLVATAMQCVAADPHWVREKGLLALERKADEFRSNAVIGRIPVIERFTALCEPYTASIRQIRGPPVTIIFDDDRDDVKGDAKSNTKQLTREDTGLLSAELTHNLRRRATARPLWDAVTTHFGRLVDITDLTEIVHDQTPRLDGEYKSTLGGKTITRGGRSIRMSRDDYNVMVQTYAVALETGRTGVYPYRIQAGIRRR
jgi:hypothetical protein